MGAEGATAPDISIVMLVKNECVHLQTSLDIVFGQEIPLSYEVIIIDSGSTDGSVELVKKKMQATDNLRLHQIQPHEFHHARTRNLGVTLARAPIICFLGGDAIPNGPTWLRTLTQPVLGDSNVDIYASYGQQLPRSDANFVNYVRMTYVYPARGFLQKKGMLSDPNDLYFFSSVNCCINRMKFEEPLFNEELPVGEELSLSVRIINSGGAIVYEPTAKVIHSHNYSALDILRRYFDTAIICRNTGIHTETSKGLMRKGMGFLTHAMPLLRQRGPADWFRFFVFFTSASLGAKLGQWSNFLPRAVKHRLTIYGTHVKRV